MLKWWFELLPLFVVRWAAKAGCERVNVGGVTWYAARRDVLVKAGQPAQGGGA